MWTRAWTCAALLAFATASQDFEFDETDVAAEDERRPQRYVYDPHSPLCRALVCKKREVCLLRDAFTALCATKKEILRKGDVIVAASSGGTEDDDDVFYDGGGAADPAPDRCVGCGSSGGSSHAQFLCGSDNRTYSSLCRLDLHNCVRRPAPPVTVACRGFCPCRATTPPRRASRPRVRPRPRHNEVLPPRRRQLALAGSSGCALDKMANRLLDWFSVLMEEARAAPPPPNGFPSGCKGEVRWMFAHLDGDSDGLLSSNELYALRHDERERCLRPFLASCGGGGGVSRSAWCGCLKRAARPCAALARAARARGGWAPACDARGFYRPRQCHAALAVCWCVDAHGQELPNSRTKGEPPCPPLPAPAAHPPADDEDAAGSGDGAPDLRY